jgi:hypothetical protein
VRKSFVESRDVRDDEMLMEKRRMKIVFLRLAGKLAEATSEG